MITPNQIMGTILISLGTLTIGLLAIFSRRYSPVGSATFWKRYVLMKKGRKPQFYGITPEQIWVVFGTLLIIAGTIWMII